VGTIVQRSAALNRRKLQALLETPPRPPPRRRDTRGVRPEPKPTQLEDLFGDIADLSDDEGGTNQPPGGTGNQPTDTTTPVVYGPCGPPPIEVNVGNTVVQVPYFAAVISRVWRTRIGGRRAILRFDRDGRCVYTRVV